MDRELLEGTAQALVAPGRGVLAADESTPTLSKRFAALGIESTEETRRDYRAMLLTAPGLSEYISGVILYDETFGQELDGRPFPEAVAALGIMPGIKVDRKAKPLAGFPGETVTEGLDGLRERLTDYAARGARFAKWRAVITIDGDRLPTRWCIEANAHALARYAALCQEAGVVPIVEPEVLMDGGHTMERHEEVTTAVLRATFAALVEARVHLEGVVLKTNMVLPGTDSGQEATPEQVATATVRCLRRSVPAAVPGVAFLSGGQSPQEATVNLQAIVAAAGPAPWQLTFSYARALQQPAMEQWRGDPRNVAAAQQALLHRARLVAAARAGRYSPELEEAA